MAGLYIHIPFCKSRCVYCGFYSTTLHQLRGRYVDALCREMELRSNETACAEVGTVYLGGGTPSQLAPDELHQLFYYINKVYGVSLAHQPSPTGEESGIEITMECNPDDITPHYAKLIGSLPVNRVSMGAQTFSDQRLAFLHRRHTASQVQTAVRLLREAGIDNISIDLMFGFPGETLDEWQRDIETALRLDVEHISAYALTYEEGTPLYSMRTQAVTDELSLAMYNLLIDRLAAASYEHYEISNFAKSTALRSRHNSNYWRGIPYVGIGAAAHSYDIDSRSWNVADVGAYIERIERGEQPVEEREELSVSDRFDDMVMTRLRTSDGISLALVGKAFGDSSRQFLLDSAQKHIARNLLEIRGDMLRLTRDGLFLSDAVMSDLMMV